MSCQFKGIAKIVDVHTIKRNLFTNNSSTVVKGDDDDPWNWSVEGESQRKETWLDECNISVSPTGELLVIAHRKVMVILTAKWDSMEESEAKIKYIMSWQGDPRKENNEIITSVLCLPVAAQGRQSVQCGADWTCIAVGFSSGAVRFYTETGSLLVSEVLHDEPVMSIKCQCFQPSRNATEPQQIEEIYVIYPNVVCCVRGFALCNTLKACRNQLARVQAHCRDRIEAPNLDLVKWSLLDQESISDMSIIGSQTPVGFSHLATASLRGGYDTSYRSSPPHTAVVMAVGIRPFVAFHCIVEGSSAPVLSDVAKAVATRLKSAIGQAVPGWLGRSRRNSVPDKTKEKSTLEAPEAMICRFGLCDALRQGISIVTCPQRKLSAVCDGLGRVILVDNISGLAVRMWKGYREAECAFLPVEENKSSFGRCALFLAIYAPKKGLIEVWAMQQGPKVITFSASKTGRLMYISHGLLGVNSLSVKGTNCSQHPCIFIDNSGLISQIIIPFHSILSDKNSKRNRDLHILKQMRRSLHSESEDEVKDLCQQLSTDEICQQALEAVASSKRTSLDLLQYVICIFLNKINVKGTENLDEHGQKCFQACQNLQRLLDFYNMVHSLQSQPPKYSTVVPHSPSQNMQDLAHLLKLSNNELQKLLMFISLSAEHIERAKVTFQQVEDSFPAFVSCFLQSYTNPPPLTLSKNTSSTSLANIGEVVCQGVLYGSCTVSEWKVAAMDSKIESKALLHASVSYWLSKPHGNNLHSELTLFTELTSAICSIEKSSELEDWWPEIRLRISSSENPCNALTAAMVMRAVCLTIEEKMNDKDGEWETISGELCAWSQMISQLEGLAHLFITACSKNNRRSGGNSQMPRLEFIPSAVSLSQILAKGPGSVSELVAKWIGSWGLPPDWILENNENSPSKQKLDTRGNIIDGLTFELDPSNEAIPSTKNEDKILEHLETLREHFPVSLSSGPLIANLAWEYVLAWVKNLDNIENFDATLRCVRTISNPHLRQGICSIIWNVHLRNKFEATVKLLHKIGKVPKERLCRQDINISDTNIKYLLRRIVKFFNIFIESCTMAESVDRIPISREAFWTEETQPSLAEVAIAQASPNSDLLLVLNQCACALHLLATFSLHLHRPVTNLFDSLGESCIWSDITSYPQLPKHHFERKLQETRSGFLKKVITAAIEPLTCNAEEKDIKEAVEWIGQCFALASDWYVSCDPLRIHQVCQLYTRNCDKLAEEIVSAVNDKETLGSQLLHIAGQRMKTVLTDSTSELKERMANLSPSLTLWIRHLEGSKINCDLKEISHLSSLAISLLPESNPDHKLATLLSEALQPLAA